MFFRNLLLSAAFVSLLGHSGAVASSKTLPEEEVQTSKKNASFLNWTQRPGSLNGAIQYSADMLSLNDHSGWGIYNGEDTYDFMNISQKKLAEILVKEAHRAGRKDVYILDSGAGNFQSCDAFAKHINTNASVLPKGMTVHIIGTRGETYLGEEVTTSGMCKLYKFGAFKIEEHERELEKRGLKLKGKVDLTISRWAHRHLNDIVGTVAQIFETTRPSSGFMIMDWGYALYEEDTFENKVDIFPHSRNTLVDFLTHTKSPFLIHPQGDPWTRETDCFILRRKNSDPLKLPLQYAGTRSCDGKTFDIGSGNVTRFKVLDPKYTKDRFKLFHKDFLEECSNGSVVFGDLKLFNWIKKNRLVKTENQWGYAFDQLMEVQRGKKVKPLLTPEEYKKSRKERYKKYIEKKEREKEIKGIKKEFFKNLKNHLPKETPPAAVGIANGAREIEHELYKALRSGNFEKAEVFAQKAELERVFDTYWTCISDHTLMDMALSWEFKKGGKSAILLLLKHGADASKACSDRAFSNCKPKEVQALLDHGMVISDPQVALYRAVFRGNIKLVDMALKNGGNPNEYFGCRPMMDHARNNSRVWNHLIDWGVTTYWGEPIQRMED